MASRTLFNSVTLRGGRQQKEDHQQSITPLRQYIDPPQSSRLQSPLQTSGEISSLDCVVEDLSPLTTTAATRSRFAILSRSTIFPIDSIAANDLLRGFQCQTRSRSHSSTRSYGMLPTPLSKDANTKDSKRSNELDTSLKHNSVSGLSFSFSSITSPNSKGLISTATNIVSPARRPVTPPDVAKAWQASPASNSKGKDVRASPARNLLGNTVEKQRVDTSRVVEKGVHSWSDSVLASKYSFDKEIGFGNWGSCWLAETRTKTDDLDKGAKVAIKLVHREGTAPSNARVKALWNEFKVLRACGKPLHENLVSFKDFVITPSYALVVMDHYQQNMNVALPVSTYAGSTGYFQQLLSGINWLHTRSVTHCDIKVANLLVDTSKNKEIGRPILVDFGFATLHDSKTNFKSKQSWGTPEYLSPERSKGELHDERLSDMWALGVTFFEIATGRTPFEHEDEQFLSKEQLEVYYKRTLCPKWVGSWSIPHPLVSLCRLMLRPDPKDRILSGEALLHPFFSKSGSYYEKTVVNGADDDRYKDDVVHQDAESNVGDEQVEEEKSPEVRVKKSTKNKPAPLKVPAKDAHVENGSPYASPRADVKDVRQSLRVPIASPLSSHQSGTEIEISNDEDALEAGKSRKGKEGSFHHRGSTALHYQEDERGNRGESSPRLSSNIEETLSSSGEATRFASRKEADKAERPRPQTFHGAMFQNKEVRQLKTSEQGPQLINKGSPYRGSNDDGFKRGYEIMPNRQAHAFHAKSSGHDREMMDRRVECISSKAQDLQMRLQRLESKEELSPGCSESSAASQAHTEELAARLDEMGILAANLARMVEESKSKLSRLHDSSMARSAASLHREKWSKANLQSPSTSHIRQYSGSNLETMRYPESVHSQNYAPSVATTPVSPSSASKSKGKSLLKRGSLRRKVSLTSWPRKPTIASTVPFPSEPTYGRYASSSHRSEVDQIGQTPAKHLQLKEEAFSPRVDKPRDGPPRSNLTRASSGRGRALSHFLTRYGARNTKTNAVIKTSSEQEEDDTARTSSTLYDKSGSSEGVYNRRKASAKTKATTALSKPFFDDDGLVEIGVNDYARQSKSYRDSTTEAVKSSVQSRASTKASRPTSRVYQSPSTVVSPGLASRKPSMSGAGAKSVGAITSIATKSPTTSQRERTLSKMKSFTLGRSNTTSLRDGSHSSSNQRTPGGSKATRDRLVDQCSSRHHEDSSEMSTTASSPIEPISPRHHQQLPSLTARTPLIGEDPPRHHHHHHHHHHHQQQRSRESSFQSPSIANTPSTPGGGLWTRLFRGYNNNGASSSGRFQSPRAS